MLYLVDLEVLLYQADRLHLEAQDLLDLPSVHRDHLILVNRVVQAFRLSLSINTTAK